MAEFEPEYNFEPEETLEDIVPISGGTSIVKNSLISNNYIQGETGFSINSDGTVEFNEGVTSNETVTQSLPGTEPATNGNFGVFWIAPNDCTVMAAYEAHEGKGTTGGAVTLAVEKLTDGQGPWGGTVVMSGTFDLKGTNNTTQTATIDTSASTMNKGERLGFKVSGTLTNVYGLTVTILIKY